MLLMVSLPSCCTSAEVMTTETSQQPIDLGRKLTAFRTQRRNWVAAFMALMNQTETPYLLELDTLTYRDMSVRKRLGLFDGTADEQRRRGLEWANEFRINLKQTTIEEALRKILSGQPGYTYEVVSHGRCLHVFPQGIQERNGWPLNQLVADFFTSRQVGDRWYRETFGPFLFKYQVHIGEFNSVEISQRLTPRRFAGVPLRQMLCDLAAMCQVGWILEPFPEEEMLAREAIDREYYERGYDIGRPGSNDWYQINFSVLESKGLTH